MMRNRYRLIREIGYDTYLCRTRKSFTVEGTYLTVEDRIPIHQPWKGERILWIAGTNAYYSVAPLFPFRHQLLCFTFCEDALRMKSPDFCHHALTLGCGGGAVPRWLLEEYPSLSVDVVDHSQEILSVCQTYFLKRWNHSRRLAYYCEEAQDFDGPASDYDFIFCDLFDGQNLAPVVYTDSFAQNLHRMIRDDGILIINCGWHHLKEVWEVYQNVFHNLQVVDREPWQTEVVKMSDSPL